MHKSNTDTSVVLVDSEVFLVTARVHNGRGRVSNEGIMLDTSARMFTSVY